MHYFLNDVTIMNQSLCMPFFKTFLFLEPLRRVTGICCTTSYNNIAEISIFVFSWGNFERFHQNSINQLFKKRILMCTTAKFFHGRTKDDFRLVVMRRLLKCSHSKWEQLRNIQNCGTSSFKKGWCMITAFCIFLMSI